MNAPVFSVVTPVFNKWELTRDCLQSLREHTPGADFEVIVVDNGSSDDTPKELPLLGESLFPGRFVNLRFEENRNFGPACNAGARAATAPLVFFLNNDTLLTSGWSGPLLEAMRGGNAPGAVGPLLLYPDNTVQHLGVAIGPPSEVTHLYKGFPVNHPVVGRKRRLQFITAAALLMPRELFLDIGGFYEGYRNGFEDVELCVRIRERGKSLACVPASRVYHLESKTSGRSDAESHNSRLLTERCGDQCYIDIHHHGRRDGFTPSLDDWDEISLLVTPEESARLFATLPPKDLSALIALVQANPNWLEGAEHLRDLFERGGFLAEALGMASKAVEAFPTAGGYKKTLALAIKTKNLEVAETCELLLRKLLPRLAKPEDRQIFCKLIIKKARLFNDQDLEQLYAKRLHALTL